MSNSLRAKAYYALHRKEQNIRRREYYRSHLKEGRESARLYRLRHPERCKKAQQTAQQAPRGRFHAYKKSSKDRGLSFSLTLWDIYCFWKTPCFYCGDSIETVGLDRVDNENGYTRDNIVSCCRRCNIWKLAMTQEEFIDRARKIAALHPTIAIKRGIRG